MVGILLKLKIEKKFRLSVPTPLLNYYLFRILDSNGFVILCTSVVFACERSTDLYFLGFYYWFEKG